jgi:N-acylneuraminate cytidylyltransferase/CMP-N,N'-diacetyllegionaminic acid synthase
MLAIIPARGGSKGIPKKNIVNLCGKPLIYYTIEEAIKSKHISEIVLSTDSEEIASIAKQYDEVKIPFMRPSHLAGDNSLAIDNYIFTLNELSKINSKNYTELVVLQPTSPLRKYEDIDNCINLFFEKEADSVISVNKAEHPPIWSLKVDNLGRASHYFGFSTNKNRQEIETAYMPNGAIFVLKKQLIESGSYYSDKTFVHIMPTERSVDIDDMIDLEFAEFLMKRNHERYK